MTNNEDVIKLAELNKKMNSFNELNNAKQVFTGVRDERDPLIDSIISAKDVYYPIDKLAREMSRYYLEIYGDDIDYTYFIDFIEQIVRILLKNFKLYEDIKDPRAFMISYLFKQKTGTFDNRIWAYFNRYYQKYFESFKNHESYEQLYDNKKYCKDDLDFYECNKFYVNYYESGINRKDTRDSINDDGKDDDLEKIEDDDLDVKSEEEEDDKDWYEEEEEDEDDNAILLHKARYPTIENSVITTYDIPYQKERVSNIVWSDQEYNEEISKIKERKLRKWHIYDAETGYFPHNITKYQKGINYFLLRDNKDKKKKFRENKEPDLIFAVCKPAEFDFTEIFFDKQAETYLKNIIIKNLSKRQQLLIGCLYYQMMPMDDVVSLMGFSSRDVLNKEKNRSLGKLKRQILNDYDYIFQEYDDTKLAYWVRKIKQRHENTYAKKEGKMLSI